MLARQREPEWMREELLVILEMAKLLEKPLDATHSVSGILRLLSQLRGLNCGRVALPDEQTGSMDVRYSYGLSAVSLRNGRFNLANDEGVTGYVMRTGSIGLVPDIDEEPLYVRRITEFAGAPPTTRRSLSFIAVPIQESGVPIGVLSVQRDGDVGRGFDPDVSLLRVAAAMIGQVLRIQDFVAEQTQQLVQENQSLKNSIAVEEMLNTSVSHGIIGSSPALVEAVKQANQVADTDAPVLLLGESGTGKEKFARMIHQQSQRREGPFICINCAAIPGDLLEAELFGYAKGGFTGATSAKPGKLVLADGGTLFLDEIGDMPLALQAKLLRVLQERQVEPIGDTRSIPVDFRVLTATHARLQENVNRGQFRLDLFYRLNVVPIALPPLRQRDGDIRRIALHYLHEMNHQYGRNSVISHDALPLLESYAWPGNVRQLINVLERAVVMAQTNRIEADAVQRILDNERVVHPPPADTRSGDGAEPGRENGFEGGAAVRRYEWVRQEEATAIRDALDQAGGNKTRAAQMLNMTTRQLRYRISKLRLEN